MPEKCVQDLLHRLLENRDVGYMLDLRRRVPVFGDPVCFLDAIQTEVELFGPGRNCKL